MIDCDDCAHCVDLGQVPRKPPRPLRPVSRLTSHLARLPHHLQVGFGEKPQLRSARAAITTTLQGWLADAAAEAASAA
jgi:hypothetical protein